MAKSTKRTKNAKSTKRTKNAKGTKKIAKGARKNAKGARKAQGAKAARGAKKAKGAQAARKGATSRTTRARKTTKGSRGPVAAAFGPGGTRNLNYLCHPRLNCIVRPPGRQHRIGPPGTTVVLEAENTDVVITFTKESPFSDTPYEQITILQGQAVAKVVKAGARGNFEYEFSCAICVTTHRAAGPEMVVP